MKLYLNYEDKTEGDKKIKIYEGKLDEIDKFTMCFNGEGELFKYITSPIVNKNTLRKIKPYSFSILTSHNNSVPVLYSNYRFLLDNGCKIDAYKKLMRMDKTRVLDFMKEQYPIFFSEKFDKETRKKMEYNPIYELFTMFEKEKFDLDSSNLNSGVYYNFFLNKIKNNYRTLRQMSSNIFDINEINELNKSCGYKFEPNKIREISLNAWKEILGSVKGLQEKELDILDKSDRIILEDYDREEIIDLDDENIGYKYE